MLNKNSNSGYKTSRRTITGGMHLMLVAAMVLSLFASVTVDVSPVYAATLTIEPITWNIIGLDSNNVDVGPSYFPVGARVCSDGATTVTVAFDFDDGDLGSSNFTGDTFINLRSGTQEIITLTFTGSGCQDAYFEVAVTRRDDAYEKTRGYVITATDVSGTVSTPTPRELFVEYLISQSRNSVTSVSYGPHSGSLTSVGPGGTMTMMVGQEYDIEVVSQTATNGYEQSETFIGLPNTIFRVLSISSAYTADTSDSVPNPNDMLYGDACNAWESNPLSPNYPSCQSTGKVGGTITQTYHIKILSVPGAPLVNPEPLGTLIYDYSGSSFHYNADFGTSIRFAYIVNANITKSFSPKMIKPGETSTLAFTINNPGPQAITNVNFADTTNWPAGMTVASTTVTYTNCGASPSPASLTVGATSASFSNITVAGYSACTIGVSVTAASNGTYVDTTNNLFINSTTDTGSYGTDTLTVSSKPAAPTTCTTPTTMATWTMPTAGQGSGGPPPPYTTKVTDVSSATASASTGATESINTTLGNPVNSWEITNGWQSITPIPPTATSVPYFQITLDTSNYGGVAIAFDAYIGSSGDWTAGNDNYVNIHAQSDSGSFTSATPNLISKQKWEAQSYAPLTTGVGTTTFRINFSGAKNASSFALIDNITITGCPRPTDPTMQKAFSPTTITTGTNSTLTFTFANPNASALTGVGFTDKLPDGLVLASSTVTGPTCTTGSISGQTITAVADTRDITLSGATLAANSSCSFSVSVKGNVAGSYNNLTTRITSIETGPNFTGGANVGYGSANLTVIDPPVISKVFGSTYVLTGNTTTLKFTITNPNVGTVLTGVAFSDPLPVGLDVSSATVSDACGVGSTLTVTGNTAPTQDTIVLDNGTIAAQGSCTFTVTVTGTTASSTAYTNTTGNVTSTNGGTGNTATANLLVRNLQPALNLSKRVGTSATGPWYSNVVLIPAGSSVYYQFIVENTGDVPLTSINITDGLVSTASCTWPNPLPVANAAGTEVATCVVGPITPTVAGYVKNTATAHGTYSGTEYDSDPDSATYQNGNFGHLPSAYAYMNLFNEGGAFHTNGTTYLGTSVTTTATDGINTSTYTYKATDDGIAWSGTWASGTGQATVTATCNPAGTKTLYAWFDWNQDNDFDDANEVQSWTVNCSPTGTSNTITITYPGGGNLAAGTYYTRFRIYDTTPTNPQPYGIAKDASGNPIAGEIEDPPLVSNGSGTPTPVTVAYFRAQRNGGQVSFEWSTSTEAGNLGFNIYSVDENGQLVQLNQELIPSQVFDSLERQDYTYTADVSGNTFYVEDISLQGETRQHGPFQLGQKYGERAVDEKIDQNAVLKAHADNFARQQAKLKSSLKVPPAALQPEKVGSNKLQLTTSLNLKVNQTGIYRVTYEMLKNAGLDLAGVPLKKIALLNQGHQVPIYVEGKGKFGPGSFIEFYGEALDTVYTDTNIYTVQVSQSPAERMDVINVPVGKGITTAASFMDLLSINRQRGYVFASPSATNDAWYDTILLTNTSSKSWEIPFELNGLADPSGPAGLSVTLWGATIYSQNPDHHLVISVNGETVTDQTFDGNMEKIINIILPAGVLKEGNNTLKLTLPGDTGAPADMVYFDRFSVTYPRLYQAQNDQLRFTAEGEAFSVTNLSSKNVLVYQLDDDGPKQLRQVKVSPIGGTFTATFASTDHSATYFVTTTKALLTPEFEAVNLNTNLERPAQFLIISHPDFIDGLNPLVQVREAQGLTVSVVDVNDVYARYTHGIFNPQAIKDYIAHAAQNLGTQYVLLVGGDTYDYRNYLGTNSISFMPSLYTSTVGVIKFAPADPLYTDLNDDGVPDLAIGRFPVRTSDQLDLMVQKTLAYAQKDYAYTSVFAADKKDGALSFKNISNSMSLSLPSEWTVENINLDDESADTARQRLITAMNRGTALITYTGHSGATEWTASKLFNTTDASSLENAGRPFVVAQWGCWNTYYVHPTNNYLVQSLLFSGDKGAAAVLGASTLTNAESEKLLGELLTPQLAVQGKTIGQALQDAKNELASSHPTLRDVLLGWTLMGDPTLVISP